MTHHNTPQDIPLKRCTKCGEQKPATIEYFSYGKSYKDGFRAQCKKCRVKYQQSYYRANKEHDRAYKHTRYLANCDAEKARVRAWEVANRERKNEYNRRWRAANPIRSRAIKVRWERANQEKRRASVRLRRARKRAATGVHTAADVQSQYKAQGGRCYWCSVELEQGYHVDHVVPLARGGSNGPENIVIACASCNHSKGNKLPTEWDGNQTRRLL